VEAQSIATGFIGSLAHPFELDGLILQVDASIGIAMYPDHGTEATALLQRGDVAMYVAKNVRNTVAVYSPEEDFNSVRHLTLKGELRQAVEEDHLVLYYQPKISSATGRVTGVEALLRWQHPRHGLVPPAEFIPLAEYTGLIKPMTHWVLEAALCQHAQWRSMGLDIPISVNCSARNLLEEDLPGTVQAKLAAHGISPDRLVLEITETAIIEDPRAALDVLTMLADLGVMISIDDFGTGYSSLEYLIKLPATELKIDRSFVLGIGKDESNAVVVRSTIDLAHNLGMKAVAEGVDSMEVWEKLRTLGCDMSQGYLFSKPVSAADFIRWLDESPWGVKAADLASA
jgi:EAL domain-containing protein (putative c-di-GMP-specific phosphodiesterase class I)